MKAKFIYTVTALLFIFFIEKQKTFSQESPSDSLQIEEIVVTGSPVKINRSNIPLSVSVVTKDQIAQTDESSLLSAISGKVPGLFVSERGITGYGVSTGSAGQVSMRGIGANPTTGILILIDGHPQFMGIMGHPLPDAYVSSDAERVEIIRGPASLLYGTNAMGGVMNIITRKQTREGLNGNVRILYGSYNTQKYMASGGFRKKGFSIFTSFNHDRTDGHRDSSDFKILNGYLKLGYDLNANLKFTADLSLANFDASDPGPDTLNAKAGTIIDITRGYGSVGIDNSLEKLSGSVKLFYNFGKHKITDGFRSNDMNYGVNLYQSYKFNDQTNLTLGADYMNYGGEAKNIKAMEGNGITFTDTSVYETGVYGFIQQQIFMHLSLHGGMRVQYHKIYGTEIIPSIGMAYTFSQSTSIKASVSKGYRSPTIRELFIKQWGANPDLKPENVINYEAAIIQSFFDRKLCLELTGFFIEGDNLITTVPGKGMMNTGKIENKGIEFAAKVNPVKLFYIDAAYSFISMKQPVYATPEHQLYVGTRYSMNKVTCMLSMQWVHNLDTEASAKVALVSYSLVNAKVMFRFAKFASMFVSAENVFDQQYAINRYYTMPGTTFFSGLNLNFE